MAAKSGQPTKYRPEYCQQLIDRMTEGFSFEACAADFNVHIDTIYEWANKHPEFSEAKKLGRAKSQQWWEKLGKDALSNRWDKFNATIWIFNMKNRFGWRDVQEIEERSTQVLEIVIDGEKSEKYAL